MTLKIGDIVYLNFRAPATYPSPNPAMVVTCVISRPGKDDYISCVWFVDGKLHTAQFPESTLRGRQE